MNWAPLVFVFAGAACGLVGYIAGLHDGRISGRHR